jgi:hypothetical protein
MARKKRKMNPPQATTALVVGTLIVATGVGAYLYSSQAQAKPAKKKSSSSCKPYSFDTAVVRIEIEKAVDAGQRNVNDIATAVAFELFGLYPDGGAVTFPPDANAKPGVQCVWDSILILIIEVFDERGITPDDGSGGDEGIDFVIHDPYDDGYPWEDASLERNNYPTPGMFADVGGEGSQEVYDGGTFMVLSAALNSALAMAAAKGYDVSVAQNIMSKPNTSASRDLRAQMASAVFCSAWNDSLYGREVPQADKNSADNLYGWVANKRSPRYANVHNDVLGMMALGQTPVRAINLNGEHKPGNNRRLPVFWIPAINLERLAGPVPTVTTAGMTWSDGTSTREPPPSVQRLGVNMNGVSLPGGAGCKS